MRTSRQLGGTAELLKGMKMKHLCIHQESGLQELLSVKIDIRVKVEKQALSPKETEYHRRHHGNPRLLDMSFSTFDHKAPGYFGGEPPSGQSCQLLPAHQELK